MLKFLSAAAIGIGVSAGAAHAATLTGDVINQMISNPTTSLILDNNVLVGPGVDLTIANTNFDFDFASGLVGDEYVLSINAGSYGGLLTVSGGVTTILLSNLDFSDGEHLVGFNVFESLFVLTNAILTPNSMSISFDDVAFSSDVAFNFIRGQFVTEPIAPVPLPAALPLFAGAVGALGLVGRWRKRRQANA
ncbi:MAG: VPLPA-CTERM sorting domain-containing protein [Bauldia sp.]